MQAEITYPMQAVFAKHQTETARIGRASGFLQTCLKIIPQAARYYKMASDPCCFCQDQLGSLLG
jgi:hypothetical protein